MNHPLTIMFIAFAVIMTALAIGESNSKQARYQCIQEVAKTQAVEKAKEFCK